MTRPASPASRARAGLPLHDGPPRSRSPFRPAAPTIVIALAYAVAVLVWVVAGDALPGGRWLAVHLFTLGVLTNLVLVFSEHFGRTLTRQPDRSTAWQPVAANVAILAVLVSLPTSTTIGIGIGASALTAVVMVAYVRLRRMRTASVGARFLWIVRTYERAHGAFVHGAILGALLGIGVFPGAWYVPARTAHLHVNVLGWGGLTLLATLVFFGPTLVRTRIVDGADARAARALRHGATGLTVGVLLLLATGFGSTAATVLRLASAAALAVFAWAATVTSVPVAQAAWRAKPGPARWPVVAVGCWFPVLVWADVAVVATGQWRLLDALGLGMFVAVLGQAIVAVLTYLAPMLRQPTSAGREALLARHAVAARSRSAVYNLAAVGIVGAAVVRAPAGAVVSRVGWAVVAVVLAWLLAASLAPVRLTEPADD